MERKTDSVHSEEELDLPLNKKKEKDDEIVYWVYVVRIILSVCLIYYHNHRLVDSYRHNLNIEIPLDYFTLQSLIKQSQRMVLQAGLNLFMAVAGIAYFFSLRKRRVNLFATMVERSFKLLFGFLFGMVVVAIPSNMIIKYCEGTSFTDDIVQLLAPGHIAFLPYLFILSQIFVPINATMLNCQEYFRKGETIHNTTPIPFHVWIYAILWSFSFLIISGLSSMTFVVAIATLVGIAGHGLNALIEFWCCTVRKIYVAVTKSRNGMIITFYTFVFPLAVLYCAKWIIPHFQFPLIGLTMVFCIPILCCFWPDNFAPFGKYLPNFTVNTSLFCLTCIIFGQLFNITNPSHLPLFPTKPTPNGVYIIESLTNGVILERDLHAILIMTAAHGAYYFFGFYLMFFRKELPAPPLGNMVFIAFMCVFYISLHTLSFSPSKDFFYITAGYTTYHTPTRRFWYHFGGWSWVCTVFIGLRYLANEPLEGNRWDMRIMRFLRDNTFGTFFIHPLFGYLLCCLLMRTSFHITIKILLLDVGVYVLSYTWSHYVQKIPIVGKLFGTRGK